MSQEAQYFRQRESHSMGRTHMSILLFKPRFTSSLAVLSPLHFPFSKDYFLSIHGDSTAQYSTWRGFGKAGDAGLDPYPC